MKALACTTPPFPGKCTCNAVPTITVMPNPNQQILDNLHKLPEVLREPLRGAAMNCTIYSVEVTTSFSPKSHHVVLEYLDDNGTNMRIEFDIKD